MASSVILSQPSGQRGILCLIRPHRIHEMQTIVINVPGVCQSVIQLRHANWAKWINVLLGVESPDLRTNATQPLPNHFGNLLDLVRTHSNWQWDSLHAVYVKPSQ